MDKSVTVRIPAKINLTLDVVGRRQDGYHFIKSVMQSISLYDELKIAAVEGEDITIKCEYPDIPKGKYPDIPCDDRNLVAKAAREFFAQTHRPPMGLEVRIIKRIPPLSGMAGGSADAAGTLLGLNYLMKADMTTEELCDIGREIGADVPFCIVGGTAMVEGIGEFLTPLPALPDCYVVVAWGDEGISTQESFHRFDQYTDLSHLADANHASDDCVAAIASGSLEALASVCHNALEEGTKLLDIVQIKTIFANSDAMCSVMTGTGSAVFGIFPKKRGAEACADELNSQGYSCSMCTPVAEGAVIL